MNGNTITNNKSFLKNLSSNRKDELFALACISPVIIGLGFVVFAPIIKAIIVSFMKYKISNMDTPEWNNFGNYKKLFKNGLYFTYLKNTVVYIFFVVAIQVVLAMIIALSLTSKSIKGSKFFRSAFLIPWTIPSVVTALLWSWLLQPQFGVLNYIFYHIGLQTELNTLWLQYPSRAMPSIIMASVWRQTPYMMIMLFAGLQSVPSELVEAAEIDGANYRSVFYNVIIPSIRPVLDTAVLVAIVNNSQMFTIIYNMTAGGPMNKTTTVSIAAYRQAFVNFDFGAGSAVGVLWLVILGTVVYVYKRRSDAKMAEYM
jgi:multiple sugar transport system permease protein